MTRIEELEFVENLQAIDKKERDVYAGLSDAFANLNCFLMEHLTAEQFIEYNTISTAFFTSLMDLGDRGIERANTIHDFVIKI